MAQELIDLTAPDADSLPAGAVKINNNFTELYAFQDAAPLNFAPLVHVHAITDVTGLTVALAAKLDSSSYTAADVFAKVLSLDGAGSGLDADLLDGVSSAGYATTAALALKLDASAYTAADVLAKLLAIDGAGSGLDADLLDGVSSAGFFQTNAALATINGTLAAPAWSFASDTDTGVYRVAGNNMGFAAGGVQVMRVQLGGSTRSVTIGDGTNSASFAFDGAAGGARDISLMSASVARWTWRVNATAEAGSSAGSDLDILRRDDAGVLLGTAVRVVRSSGQWQFENGAVAAPELSFLSDPDCGLYRIGTNNIGLSTNGALGLAIDATQRVYGAALHNNASSPTGTTNQYLASGTYTPTLTNTTNLAGSTAFQCQWMRVGNVVTVSGRVSVDPTAAGQAILGISLPLASNLGAVEDCAGVAFASGVAGQGAAIWGDATNDRAAMEWIAVDLTNQGMSFTFTYEII